MQADIHVYERAEDKKWFQTFFKEVECLGVFSEEDLIHLHNLPYSYFEIFLKRLDDHDKVKIITG